MITHGWTLTGGLLGSGFPDWAYSMGEAVLYRVEGKRGLGHLFKSDSETGLWASQPSVWQNGTSSEQEIVLLFDWGWESNDQEDGWLEAAADHLLALLAAVYKLASAFGKPWRSFVPLHSR